MREWLAERRDAGIEWVGASFAGHGAIHDRWNGRQGDFDFLTRIQRIAADLGMKRMERLFVIKSLLPDLDESIERLNLIPGQVRRFLCLFYYRGYAVRFEDDRITEEIRDGLPKHIAALIGDLGEWRSEREWLKSVPDKKDYMSLQA